MLWARLLLWLAATALGAVLGFGLAWVALGAVQVVLPHCGVACDDTLPEFVAVAAAYGTWFLTTVAVSMAAAWRLWRR